MSLTNINSTIDKLNERITELQLALDQSYSHKRGLQTTLKSTRLALNDEKKQNQLLRERVQALKNEIISENEDIRTEVEGKLLECYRILSIEQEINQKIQELNQEKQDMQDHISNLSRVLSTVETQITEMERTSNKQKKDMCSLVIKVNEVETKNHSEDEVQTLLMEMDPFDELLARNRDVNDDLQNQLPHIQAMSTESEEQHAHRVIAIAVSTRHRAKTEIDTGVLRTAQVQVRRLETREGASRNEIKALKETISAVKERLSLIRCACIADELQYISCTLELQMPHVTRDQFLNFQTENDSLEFIGS